MKVRCRKTANSRRSFNIFKGGNDFDAQLEALFFIQAINLFHFLLPINSLNMFALGWIQMLY